MKINISARLKALEEKINTGYEVYIIDMVNDNYFINGKLYSPEQFQEWCSLHPKSVVILDDLG